MILASCRAHQDRIRVHSGWLLQINDGSQVLFLSNLNFRNGSLGRDDQFEFYPKALSGEGAKRLPIGKGRTHLLCRWEHLCIVISSIWFWMRNMKLQGSQCTHHWATGAAWVGAKGSELWESEDLDRWGWDLPPEWDKTPNNTIYQVRLAKAMGNTVTAISTSAHKEMVARWSLFILYSIQLNH